MIRTLVNLDGYHGPENLGPASEEELKAYQEALSSGKTFFLRGYHGYNMRCKVLLETD